MYSVVQVTDCMLPLRPSSLMLCCVVLLYDVAPELSDVILMLLLKDVLSCVCIQLVRYALLAAGGMCDASATGGPNCCADAPRAVLGY